MASPEDLRQFREPKIPADLERHKAVVFTYGGLPRPWLFKGPAGVITLRPVGPIRTNDAEHIRAAVRARIGVAHNSSWLLAPDIASGTVLPLLGDFAPNPYPSTRSIRGRGSSRRR